MVPSLLSKILVKGEMIEQKKLKFDEKKFSLSIHDSFELWINPENIFTHQ
jgi:hypothetical protein